MAEIIYTDDKGKLAFGDYHLKEKTKVEDFPFGGDLLKVKTYEDITRFEKNGLFVYESVPGTAVHGFMTNGEKVVMSVEGNNDAQVTLELEPETEYKVHVNDVYVGKMKTNLGGKLVISVELEASESVNIIVEKQ